MLSVTARQTSCRVVDGPTKYRRTAMLITQPESRFTLRKAIALVVVYALIGLALMV